jgi:hypothetical protein
MNNNSSNKAKYILFYFNVLILLSGLFLVGGNIYGLIVNGCYSLGLYAGFVIIMYSIISLFRGNPYKSKS